MSWPVQVYGKRYRAVQHHSVVLPEEVWSAAGFYHGEPCYALAARGVVVISDFSHRKLAERLLAELAGSTDVSQRDASPTSGSAGTADREEGS